MYSTIKALSIFAIAGTALAAPAAHEKRWNGWGQWHADGYMPSSNAQVAATTTAATTTAAPTTTAAAVVVTTATTTATYGAAQLYGGGNNNYGGGNSHSHDSQAQTSAPAAPTQASAPATDSDSSDYMSTVNQYRQMMGKSSLTKDSTLEANALKTAVDGKGSMNHELNPGSMAQVLAPGDVKEFVHCFVGGWLCEIPSLLPSGSCTEQSKGWAYDGTGHAEILSSGSYSKIGCAWNTGIWACDLA